MIKLVFCLRRLPAMTFAEFSAYWRDKHAPLVRDVAPILHIHRYTQSHGRSLPQMDQAIAARGGLDEPYDGIAELWWASTDAMFAAGATEEGREAGRRLVADERNFIDLARSVLFFTEEDVIIPGS